MSDVYWPEPRPNTRYYPRVRLVQHSDGYLYSEDAPWEADLACGTVGKLSREVLTRQGPPFSFTEAGRASNHHDQNSQRQRTRRRA